MRLDLHIHSSHSMDATASPGDILSQCRRVGLGGCSITDHNSFGGSSAALAATKDDGFVVVRGIEVSTSEGHVLAYGMSEVIPKGLPLAEVIERIEGNGGLAVAAHPRRFPSGMGMDAVVSAGFRAVEVLNGGSSARANRAAAALAKTHALAPVGGSDAHELDEIGRAYTIVEDCCSEDDVIAAISKGHSSVGGRSRTRTEGMAYAYETLSDWLRRGMDRV